MSLIISNKQSDTNDRNAGVKYYPSVAGCCGARLENSKTFSYFNIGFTFLAGELPEGMAREEPLEYRIEEIVFPDGDKLQVKINLSTKNQYRSQDEEILLRRTLND